MNSKILSLTAVLAASAAFAAFDDTTYFFRTEGVDRYADGTQVVVGERYALVWSAGDFAGFKADGSLVNEADEVVGIFSLATAEGNCPLSSYGVPSSIVSKGGNILLWLLDTRKFAENGEVSLSEFEAPTKLEGIAGAAKVAADISVAGAAAKVAEGAASMATQTELPADAPKPVVKAVRIDDGAGLVYLTVGNTAPYLAYDVAGGDKVDELEGGKAQNPVSGGAGDITLITQKQGSSGFFKVIRK